jgi:hypothetical protein
MQEHRSNRTSRIIPADNKCACISTVTTYNYEHLLPFMMTESLARWQLELIILNSFEPQILESFAKLSIFNIVK